MLSLKPKHERPCELSLNVTDISLHKPTSKSWVSFAFECLRRIHGFSCKLSKVEYQKSTETGVSRHLFYRQSYKGYLMTDAWMRLDLELDREILNGIHCRFSDDKALGRIAIQRRNGEWLKKTEAKRLAKKELKTEYKKCKSVEFRLFRKKGTKTYRMALKTQAEDKTKRVWTFYHDCEKRSLLFEYPSAFGARGLVFDPTPMVSLNNTSLIPGSAIPRGAYLEKELLNLRNTGFLDGSYVTTRGTRNRIKRENGDFRILDSSQAFGEVMAYYHIDRLQTYVQSLGFRRANPRAVKVVVNGLSGINSEYRPSSNSILLGTGGAPDYQDAEIILHEYAHAIHSTINSPFGRDNVSVNLAEGFADYLALSQTYAMKTGRFQRLFACWDASAHLQNPTSSGIRYWRKLNRNSNFSDFSPLNGRNNKLVSFWADVLWEIREKLGPRRADALALGHLYVINSRFSFFDAAVAIVEFNRRKFDDLDKAKLVNIFRRRGIAR